MRQQGFILVAAIWLLAVLAMAAGFFSLWLQRSINLAQIQLERSQGAIDIQSTQATALYMLSTYGLSQAGIEIPVQSTNAPSQPASMSLDDFFKGTSTPSVTLDEMGDVIHTIDGNEIRLDSSSYTGLGTSFFALQDNGGLIDVVRINPQQLTRLLNLAGDSTNNRPEELIAKLQDYVDPDDLHRLNGAESYHYQQASMPPPTNTSLKTPAQLTSVLGWNQYPQLLTDDNLYFSLSITPRNLLNLNAATKTAMMVELDIDEATADHLIQRRNERPFSSLHEVVSQTDLYTAAIYDQASVYPSRVIRLYLWHKEARLERVISIRLNNLASHASPWLIATDISQTISEQHANAESQKPETRLFD
jgi:general secretion pathway protein K